MTIKLRTHKYKKSVFQRAMQRITAASVAQAKAVPMPTLEAPASARPTKAPRRRRSQYDQIPTSRAGVAPGLFGTGVDGDEAAPPEAEIALTRARLTEQVPNFTEYPYSAVGKMFMVDGNSNFVGTGWVIGRKAIATAAHCLVNDNGDFFDPVTFFPSFSGSTDQATFRVVEAAVPDDYLDRPFPDNLPWDLGVAILDRDISQTTGFLGYNATGEVPDEEYEGIGYPANRRPLPGENDPVKHNFDGSKMWHSIGDFTGTVREVHGFQNEMTGGSSGGAIVQNGDNVCFGLISHRLVPHTNEMFSPILDDDFVDMVQWLADNDAFF